MMKCYRFVTEDLKSQSGKVSWTPGEWVTQDGDLNLCKNGLHACQDPRDSLNNIYGSRWWVAESGGHHKYGNDKFCSSKMRLIKEIPKSVIIQYAVDCAERVLHIYEDKYPGDYRPRKAIEAARSVNAAYAAAYAAADAAAYAADAAKKESQLLTADICRKMLHPNPEE